MSPSKSNEEKIKITDSLHELEKIVGWFEAQNEVDVEQGLDKVKQGVELINQLKKRIKKVENEFEEIKKGLIDDEED